MTSFSIANLLNSCLPHIKHIRRSRRVIKYRTIQFAHICISLLLLSPLAHVVCLYYDSFDTRMPLLKYRLVFIFSSRLDKQVQLARIFLSLISFDSIDRSINNSLEIKKKNTLIATVHFSLSLQDTRQAKYANASDLHENKKRTTDREKMLEEFVLKGI